MLFFQVLKFMWFMLLNHLLEEGGSDGEDEDDEEIDSGEEGDEEDADDSGSDEKKKGDVKDPSARITALEDQIERRKRRERRKDRLLADAQKELDRLKAGHDNDDEAQREERDKEAEQLRAENQRLRAENALITHERIAGLSRVRQRTITRLIRDDVEFDESDNNIDDLLDDLEKEEPDLFTKVEKDTSDDKDDDGKKSSGSSASGKPVGGGKKKDKNAVDEAQLAERFSVLKQRRRTGLS